ncbi:hypothetical protein [Paenibacillus mucilaginosus]|uniref:Uncharacterized protein n=1 Tax=Paenibacillus mucilaginosus (strain KNP414) TaxID=1036673 RepID=F8FCB1_PAEMK|nr:hypothetical protein [Paenibacillus mucilaginosus]AEI45230.1 hypothetical protein KNP414_06711 [Paenibacillus mucilaginosus KNP414]MCG7212882.1 hypothetical protein [Paenibacillus mucilaginosus]WDM26700.1 hypothetical protein KCX80_30460 [Paenibacillus mucilaginosus]
MSHTVSLDIRTMMQQLGIHPERAAEFLSQIQASSSLEAAAAVRQEEPNRQPQPIL